MLLVEKLRQLALQMYEVVTETWHLIQLDLREQFEKIAATGVGVGGNITVAVDDDDDDDDDDDEPDSMEYGSSDEILVCGDTL